MSLEPNTPAAGTTPDLAIQEALLANCVGEGFEVIRRGRHWILLRHTRSLITDEQLTLECLRLTPLEGKRYGLSLKRHDGRWTRVPVQGSLAKISTFVQRYLHHWVEA